jgi:hypothetical protein
LRSTRRGETPLESKTAQSPKGKTMITLLHFALSIFNTILRGLLIKIFWVWFVMSQFAGLPNISVLAAIGLSYFVFAVSPWKSSSFKEWQEDRDADKEEKKVFELYQTLGMTLVIVISLGVGWVIHALM